jgi:hypothetical protein
MFVCTQIGIALIIGNNKENVGLLRTFGFRIFGIVTLNEEKPQGYD